MTIFRTTSAVIALALASACAKEPNDVRATQAPVAVSIDQVRLEDMPSFFEAGGVVRARTTAVIASRIMAPVLSVHVRPGDRVRRGQALVTLDSRDIAAVRAQASATAASAEDAAQAALSDIHGAEAQVRLARATHDRIAGLHAQRSATAQELDQAVAALTAADAQLASAKARAAAASSARDAAKAASTSATVTATYAVLTAPSDGLITSRSADPGSLAIPGTPLLTLEDPSGWRLEAQVDEGRAAQVAIGQPVEIRLDNDGDRWLPGRIVEISRVEASAHGFLLKAEFAAAAGMRSGLFGRVRIPGASRRTLTVPSAALIRRGQLTFVFATTDGAARLRAVMPGATGGDRVEILAGLKEGDQIVVDPPASVADGTPVSQGPSRGASR